ncbi:MAG TPA: LysM peptidoglycan-binding domain-containing protein [Blastocatellia bacterium]|nr:LysM peptidoglycan-binding domain-containing protein [Blastocatellia bacterium]
MIRRIITAAIIIEVAIPALISAQTLSAITPTPVLQGIIQDRTTTELITRAEHYFQRGEGAYRQGDFARARQDFDRALDVLLGAGFDLRTNPTLWTYYRRLIERIAAYQLDALARGQGVTEQKYEPSPLEQWANVNLDPTDLTPDQDEIVDPHLDFPVTLTPEVRQFIHYFTRNPRGRAAMEAGLRRSGRYLELAQKIFAEEGVPLDLVWLAQAESNWRPNARSRKGAQGIWQFVSFTGAKYGLRQTSWLDERSGIEQPTRAAARYLKWLYERYLDWQLAVAAYNCGEGAVDRAIAASGYADFWYLHRNRLLPMETRNYVPIILAIIVVAKNREKYGFGDVIPEPRLEFEHVIVEGPVDLRLIAEAGGVPFSTIQELNPELKRALIPAGTEHPVRVPVGVAEDVQSLLAKIPGDRRSYWRIHQLAAGETLDDVADRHRVSADEIARLNDLDSEDGLVPGMKLIVPSRIPRTPLSASTRVMLARRSYGRATIKARPGDTITKIAARYGLSATELARLNRMSVNSKLRAGQRIVLNLPPPHATSRGTTAVRTKNARPTARAGKGTASHRATHRVRSGDTLVEIANRYGVSVNDLRRWNGLSSNLIRPGQTLILYR